MLQLQQDWSLRQGLQEQVSEFTITENIDASPDPDLEAEEMTETEGATGEETTQDHVLTLAEEAEMVVTATAGDTNLAPTQGTDAAATAAATLVGAAVTIDAKIVGADLPLRREAPLVREELNPRLQLALTITEESS